jgi:HK97 family phage prohead protease
MEFERPEIRQKDIPDYVRSLGGERRFFVSGIEIRNTEGKPKTFRGYGLKFNTLSEDFGGWRERIAPGFLDNVLANDVRILRDHSPSMILGRTSSGTARIGVDSIGGWYEYEDPGTTYSQDLAISIARGDVNQSSFAFTLPTDNGDVWEKQKDGTWLRTLLSAGELFDMSPVTYPAYPDTSIGERAFKKMAIPMGIQEANELIEREREYHESFKRRLKLV